MFCASTVRLTRGATIRKIIRGRLSVVLVARKNAKKAIWARFSKIANKINALSGEIFIK